MRCVDTDNGDSERFKADHRSLRCQYARHALTSCFDTNGFPRQELLFSQFSVVSSANVVLTVMSCKS